MSDAIVVGELFAAGSAKSVPAQLVESDGRLRLVRDDGEEDLNWPDLTLSDRLANVPRRVSLPDGRVFVTRDHAALIAMFAHEHGFKIKNLLAASEIFRPRIMAVLALLLVAVIVSLRFALPFAADVAASTVPASWEAQMGAGAFETFELLVEPSNLPAARQDEVRAMFDDLVAHSRLDAPIDLHVRDGGRIGPNAFALPGGPVIITDQLIELAPTDDGIAGVLAHEIAHIEERHGLRRVLRATGWVLLISVMAGDSGGLIEEVAGVPTILIDQSYSRSFETEADNRGVEIMRAANRDPAALADMLDAIVAACGEICKDMPTWLSSHPAPAGRTQNIRDRAAQ